MALLGRDPKNEIQKNGQKDENQNLFSKMIKFCQNVLVWSASYCCITPKALGCLKNYLFLAMFGLLIWLPKNRPLKRNSSLFKGGFQIDKFAQISKDLRVYKSFKVLYKSLKKNVPFQK